MDLDLKRNLPKSLESIGPEYGLVELVYPSFLRAYGFQLTNLSAADAVECLQGLLEAAHGIKMEVDIEGGRGGGEWFGGTRTWSTGDNTTADRTNGTVDKVKQDQQWHVQNFWTAYDACEK